MMVIEVNASSYSEESNLEINDRCYGIEIKQINRRVRMHNVHTLSSNKTDSFPIKIKTSLSFHEDYYCLYQTILCFIFLSLLLR